MAQNRDRAKNVVGVDLGETKIRAGVCTPDLELCRKVKYSTKAERGELAVLERIAHTVRDAVDEADLEMTDVCGVGIAAPGTVDLETGMVIDSPNLKWREVPLRKWLEQELGLPVFVENDGNACVLGVYREELKSRPKSMLGIFIGASISGGLMVGGKLQWGTNQAAGEIGHLVLQADGPECRCGTRGCFEAIASRTAIVQRLRAAIKAGEPCVLSEMVEDWGNLRSGDLRKALRRGDKLVAACLLDAAGYIGMAVASLAQKFTPEMIVLGGGLLEAVGEDMLPTVLKTAGALGKVEIRLSTLGDEAGIIGSAIGALQETR
jgi:glucokinase